MLLAEAEAQFPGCTDPSRCGLAPTAAEDQMTPRVLLRGPLIGHQSGFAWSSSEAVEGEECRLSAFTLR